MKLVVVRHAEALNVAEDPNRGLSQKGRSQAQSVGEQLRGVDLHLSDIQHSSKARAQQTAQIMAQAIPDAPQPQVRPGLKPNDLVEPVIRDILDRHEDLMLVGHLPFVRDLVAVLISHADQRVPDFSTSTAVVLERQDTTGAFRITQTLLPR